MAHSFDDTDSSHYAGCPLRTYSYEVGSGDTFPLCECNRIATLATKPIVTLDQLNAELKRQAQLIADANGVMMEQAKAIAELRALCLEAGLPYRFVEEEHQGQRHDMVYEADNQVAFDLDWDGEATFLGADLATLTRLVNALPALLEVAEAAKDACVPLEEFSGFPGRARLLVALDKLDAVVGK